MLCDELKAYVAGFDGILHKNQRHGDVYLKDDVDAAVAELKAKLKDVQASAYAESVDAGMRERRLRRELWLARAKSAENAVTNWCRECMERWNKVERKCRAMADKYGEEN